ncbi:MAG: hypothetical protein HYX71_08855 [Opitutae bacterium]|nr:hypothetical protein [Opitutae bacterium]
MDCCRRLNCLGKSKSIECNRRFRFEDHFELVRPNDARALSGRGVETAMRRKAFTEVTTGSLHRGAEQQGVPAVAKAMAGSTSRAAAGEEDVSDIRNTRVIDIYYELQTYGVDVSCYDPEANLSEVKHEYGIELLSEAPQKGPFDAVILAVKHRAIVQEFALKKLQALGGHQSPILIDVKGMIGKSAASAPDGLRWQL